MPPSPPVTGPRADAATLPAPLVIQRALAACQRGELREARELCRTLLDLQPSHFEALYLLAIIEGQSGSAQQAVDLFSRAVSVNPASADAHFNRGVALGELVRYEEAVASYDRALSLRQIGRASCRERV